MQEWCRRLGHDVSHRVWPYKHSFQTNSQKPSVLNKLNVIHVAGTKGKGSTSAFVSSILQQYTEKATLGPQLGFVGLYSSPHLRSVRERIRINGKPLSEPDFARFFFDVWDRLDAAFANDTLSEAPADPRTDAPIATREKPRPKPVYFRYITLMGLHAYYELQAADKPSPVVLEVGLGGEYDSTNVVEAPSITAITSLGIDHTPVLGDTIDKIAWHKAGIFKQASPHQDVYTVPQPALAMPVLEQRAKDAGKTLQVIETHPDIAAGTVRLGLAGDFQQSNASLAVACAAAWLRLHFPNDTQDVPAPGTTEKLPEAFVRGLALARWPGRCETRIDKHVAGLKWHIDGGHTAESLALAATWFAKQLRNVKGERVLVFNQQTRDAPALARTLYASLKQGLAALPGGSLFSQAIFCTNVTFKDASRGYKADLVSINSPQDAVKGLDVQRDLAKVWTELDAGCQVQVAPTIQDAIEGVRSVGGAGQETAVLVTGSLHLVGGVLEVLDEGEEIQ